jgi:hypothetical protein
LQAVFALTSPRHPTISGAILAAFSPPLFFAPAGSAALLQSRMQIQGRING